MSMLISILSIFGSKLLILKAKIKRLPEEVYLFYCVFQDRSTLMIVPFELFGAGQFADQSLGLVDQDREMLWANPVALVLVLNCQQGDFLAGLFAYNAGLAFDCHSLSPSAKNVRTCIISGHSKSSLL
jgi:hypothetical protein